MSDWIEIKEGCEMPEPYRVCIVFMALAPTKSGSFYDFAFFAPPSGLDAGAWGRAPNFQPLRGNVTHWMPLPAPPKIATDTKTVTASIG